MLHAQKLLILFTGLLVSCGGLVSEEDDFSLGHSALSGLCDPTNPIHNCPSGMCNPSNASDANLTEVTDFGSNEGGLRMLKYVPANLPANAPLVVVLHGCSQNATTYASLTGWNTLADKYRFAVLYPEQVCRNNAWCCFNWAGYFDDPTNLIRDRGENRSIIQMIDRMIVDHSLDLQRVFVTGASSGASAAALLCGTWPDRFAAGASLAGVPYYCTDKCAEVQNPCMSPGRNQSAQAWGDKVRSAYPGYTGPFPRFSIWHGTSDTTVGTDNLTEMLRQWTNVHGLDQTPSATDTVKGHSHKMFNKGGVTVVETYEVQGGGHAIPVDPGSAEDQCGQVGSYAYDKNICSTYYISKFFGLLGPGPEQLSIQITTPADGASVSGVVRVQASAVADAGVREVRFEVDGLLLCTLSQAPYSCDWDTGGVADGQHTIRTLLTAENGKTAEHVIRVTTGTVTVGFRETFSSNGPDNTGWSIGAFALDVSDHTGGASKSLTGKVSPSWNDTATSKEASVRITLGQAKTFTYFRKLNISCTSYSCSTYLPAFFRIRIGIDGASGSGDLVEEVIRTQSGSYAETNWTERSIDIAKYAGKTVVVRFQVSAPWSASAQAWIDDIAIDGGGGPGPDNPPSVAIAQPASGQTVSGTASIQVNASDDKGVTKVMLAIDDGLLGEDDSTPYGFTWDTKTVADGAHRIKASATDTAGQVASKEITVTVNNSGSGCQSTYDQLPPAGSSEWAKKMTGSYGGLNMYLYVPAGVCADEPATLVVALHGCMQSASSFAHDTEWNKLADRYKFIVLWPEHTGQYNQCFDWYSNSALAGQSHTGQVRAMINTVKGSYAIGQVFATGLSAGAGLAVILAARFPTEIDGAAVMSGLPFAGYSCDGGFSCAVGTLNYIQNAQNKTPQQWAQLMPQNPGTYPPVIEFHGSADRYVHPSFQTELVKQWTAVQGADQIPEVDTTLKGFPYKEYHGAGGIVLVATVSLTNMEHGVAVDPNGSGEDAGGAVCTTSGPMNCFAYDKGIYSSYYAARFLGIIP